jgi:uncharacterized membrane protein
MTLRLTSVASRSRSSDMSDPTTPAASDDAALADATTVESADTDLVVEAAAVTDGAYTLFVADFNDTETAWEAYELLTEVEDGRTVQIEGVLVVKRDADGQVEVQKATDRSTRRGLGWGVVGGVVLGVLFPPSIIGSAVVLGAGGAAIGKAREVHHRKELEEELADAIEPGHSGIIALVSDPGAVEIRKALDKADAIVEKAVDKVVAEDIKAAAKESEGEAQA